MERFRLVIGLPVDLHAALKALAEREHRSVSAQIVHYLAAAVAGEYEEKSAKAEER